jgi:hypothetical protein
MKIAKPSLGRIVIYTAFRGHTEERVDEYAGFVVKVHDGGVIDMCTLGSNSIYHNHSVPYDATGRAGTWRYPEIVREEIEVPADATVKP